MQVSAVGLSLIRRFEGCSLVPYLCPAHYWTIGYGHVLTGATPQHHPPITMADAVRLLESDARLAAAAVSRLINVPLSQNQFDALASFTFNLGAAALQRATLRRVVNRGDHAQVPTELMRWVWGGGQQLPGLIARRAAEGALYGRID
ncbi:MAG: lysozyme [Rickettsiales bacterium]